MNKSQPQYDRMLSELGNVLRESNETAVADRVALRDAVCGYVFAEYDRGTSAADVLVIVTRILESVERGADGAVAELAQLLIDWCREFNEFSLAARGVAIA